MPRVRHYVGVPPELSGGCETRREMPPASVLLIEQSEEGVFLLRYAATGHFAGDTWHPTVEQAKEQAVFEYGDAVAEWRQVPADINDVMAFMASA
jgi:hypothetical protein